MVGLTCIAHFTVSHAGAMLERWLTTTSLRSREDFPTINGGHPAARECSESCGRPRKTCFILCSRHWDGGTKGGQHNGMPLC